MTLARRSTALFVTVAASAALGACGDATQGAGRTVSTTATSTADTTGSATDQPTLPSLPSPSITAPGKPNTTLTVPPPARDPDPIPDNAQDYGAEFVKAWVDRDRVRAAQLATPAAVDQAFASTAKKTPTFSGCEGAAGSVYCRWEGVEYTMTVRIANQKAAQALPDAVSEVTFGH